MIPKIIHACWFGNNELPENYKRYIDGWRQLHPDYEIIIWTLESFEKYFDNSKFVNFCKDNQIFGFLSDYFRLKVLYEFGGIYIDTDVELLKNLDCFLDSKMFIGYIFDCSIGTALIGCEKGYGLCLELIEVLEKEFELSSKLTVSNDWMTKWFIENYSDFKFDGRNQILSNGIAIYQKDYFERMVINKNSTGGYAIHHCDGTWRHNGFARKYIKPIVKLVLSKKMYEKLTIRRLTRKQKYYKEYLKRIAIYK